MILNDDGLVLTANHIIEELENLVRETQLHRDYASGRAQIENDPTLSQSQRRRRVRSLTKPGPNTVTHFSCLWGINAWTIESFTCNKLADIAIGKIVGFDKNLVKIYPEFKNPSSRFEVGINLCKLGFPLYAIEPDFDETTSAFTLPADTFPVPLFPIEGIFTREIIMNDGQDSAQYVETSTPGLLGQSGGPTFDEEGRVWAMQSRTIHHPLGFSPENSQGRKEHQFLNCGMGTHAKSIIENLENAKVSHRVSND